MNSDELKAMQAPIKQRYRDEPEVATITLHAEGRLGENVSCSVQTGQALVEAGLHPATDCMVTPAHAASACSNMSPEHASMPSPPVAGCRPASTRA
jgi:hypothetical protein